MIVKTFNRKGIIVTTKDRHVLEFWYSHLSACIGATGRTVSAGEVARHVGQSIGTAKKYLNRLVGEGAIASYPVEFKNGVVGVHYGHIE